MEELESQIAKIQLGNTKTSSTYVFVLAEKAPAGNAELYVVAELPLFNPAAEESCERICLALAATLKRAYKKAPDASTFENAIAQVNEELGKLASMGQTAWINKLNCVLGVKDGSTFNIATCGKVSAYLLRNREYTDISCSPAQAHPLKTFENFAAGKLRLGDLLILSTTQLFNYLAMDRLLNIVSNSGFLSATQTVIQLLKENSDPQVSFAVLLNLQIPPGQANEEDIDLENYIVEAPAAGPKLWDKALSFAKNALMLGRGPSRVPKTDLPKVSFGTRLKNVGGGAKNLLTKSKGWWQFAKTSAKSVKSTVDPQKFKRFSPQKKFFLASALVLLLAVSANIFIAAHVKKTRANEAQVLASLQAAQTLLSNAQASLLYKDDAAAANYFTQAKNKIPQSSSVDSTNKDLYNKVVAELNSTQQQMEKIIQPQVTDLGSLGAGKNLIKLPGYAAVQINQALISYNKSTGQIQDSALKTGGASVVASVFMAGNNAAIYDGAGLYIWDFSAGTTGNIFTQNMPGENNFAGMAYYPTNNRVYVADKSQAQIISYVPNKNVFSKPVIAAKDGSLSQAVDVTIDGSIYVLTKTGVIKFQSGKLADFTLAALTTPLSGSGKIYTQKEFAYLYILDPGNNRILVFDKKGNLVESLKSDKFTNLKDFQVDEKGKVIYVLNDGSLLKVALP